MAEDHGFFARFYDEAGEAGKRIGLAEEGLEEGTESGGGEVGHIFTSPPGPLS